MSRNSFLAAGLTVMLTMSAIAQQSSTGFEVEEKRRLSMSNTPFSIFLTATVAWALAIPAAAQGAGRYVEVEYPPSAAPGELQVGVTYILWIPDSVTRLRGVIVHQHEVPPQLNPARQPFLK